MINQSSIDAVKTATYRASFIRPLYETFCFSQLPHTIQKLLGVGEIEGLPESVLPETHPSYDTIIVFLIDAFGWRFFYKYAASYPFLQHFINNGVVSCLTSQFPSTTAAHVTTIHTGLAPAQSGVYEWYQYQPSLNALIAPLMFNFAGELARDTLGTAGLDASDVFPKQSIYRNLSIHGVKSAVFQSAAFANSKPSRYLLGRTETVPFKTFPEALVQLGKRLDRQEAPSYYLLYLANVDRLGHAYGPDSEEVEAEIDSLLVTLERLVLGRLSGRHPRTLLVFTADHGMTDIRPGTTMYLNRIDSLRSLRHMHALNNAGSPIVPAGSARDLFLHIKPEYLADAEALLKTALAQQAMVVRTSDLIKDGLFGPTTSNISQSFLDRVGNIVLLPYKHESVYWYERGRFEQSFLGHHGGLTTDEMEIPLLTCNL